MTNKTFDSLGLSPATIKAVKKIKYTAPKPVQAEVIPLALNGKDVIASAQTGSGKTAAFTIPAFNIMTQNEDAKCLVVAPTRELAQQIQTVFQQLANDSGIKNTLIVGGKCMEGQLKKLKTNPRFVVGTPGRLNDHLKRKSLVLADFKYVVWDEMDRMLDLGFIHQIENIMKFLPKERQTLMFSATFPKRVLKLAESYLKEPIRVEIDTLNSVCTDVQQDVIEIGDNSKLKELTKLLGTLTGKVLVFTKTQRGSADMAKSLTAEGFDAMPLHGGLRQAKRDKTVKDFRENVFNVLVATDVAARGLDIPDIAYVINFELPQSPEEYIHRIGRTGRAGVKGKAIALLGRQDKSKWRMIQKFLGGEEEETSQQTIKREAAILKSNRENGPFPTKREGKDSFKEERGHSGFRKEGRREGRRSFGRGDFSENREPLRRERGEHRSFERKESSSDKEQFRKKETFEKKDSKFEKRDTRKDNRRSAPVQNNAVKRLKSADYSSKPEKRHRPEEVKKTGYAKPFPATSTGRQRAEEPKKAGYVKRGEFVEFKKASVGKKKDEKPKKYGNGPAKRWAKVLGRKTKGGIPDKFKPRKRK